MPRKTRPVAGKAILAPPIPTLNRGLQSSIDYRTYSRRALLRFDLEGKVEAIRQHRAWLSLCISAGESAMAEKIRDTVERERAHVIDLATVLAEDDPDGLEREIRTRSRRFSRCSDT